MNGSFHQTTSTESTQIFCSPAPPTAGSWSWKRVVVVWSLVPSVHLHYCYYWRLQTISFSGMLAACSGCAPCSHQALRCPVSHPRPLYSRFETGSSSSISPHYYSSLMHLCSWQHLLRIYSWDPRVYGLMMIVIFSWIFAWKVLKRGLVSKCPNLPSQWPAHHHTCGGKYTRHPWAHLYSHDWVTSPFLF